MSKPRFRAVSSFPTSIKRNEGREGRLWTRRVAAEGRPCWECLARTQKGGGESGLGNVGCWIFHGSCMSASWALQGLPRVLEKSVAICANPISFSAFLVSHISE